MRQVAGAAAAAGLPLADVAAEAKHASEMVGTMGVASSVCTLPGQVTSDRLGPGKMELGLGIVSCLKWGIFSLKKISFLVVAMFLKLSWSLNQLRH